MLINGRSQSLMGKQANKRMLVCLLVIGLMVLLIVANTGFQAKRINHNHTKLYTESLIDYYDAQIIKNHLSAFASLLQNITYSMDAAQSNTALAVLYGKEQQIAEKLQKLSMRDVEYSNLIKESQQIFSQWVRIRAGLHQIVLDGEVELAQKLTKTSIADFLWDFEQSVDSIILYVEQKKQEIENQSNLADSNVAVDLLVVSICLSGCIFLLLYLVWRNVAEHRKKNDDRQALIDEHVLLAVLDEKGQVEDVSGALSRFFLAPKKELIRAQAPFLLSASKQDNLLGQNILNSITQGKQWRGEVSFINAENSTLWADCKIIPMLDKAKKVIGYTQVMHDLTNNKLADIDKLTGLLNRRSYDDTLTNQLNLAVRNKYAITLAILDIDHLSAFNSLYGHFKGDEVLCQVGELLHQSMQRANDFVFRIGGEEFALIVSGLDEDKVNVFLNNLRQAVKGLKIANKNSNVDQYVSVSIGAVVLEQGYITEQKLYKAADKALYQAKTVRDRVVVNTLRGEKLI